MKVGIKTPSSGEKEIGYIYFPISDEKEEELLKSGKATIAEIMQEVMKTLDELDDDLYQPIPYSNDPDELD